MSAINFKMFVLFLSIVHVSRCMDDRLTPFYSKAIEFNAHIQHLVQSNDDTASIGSYATNQRNIPYVGNGYFGLEIANDAALHVKYGRHLSQSIGYQPIVRFEYHNEASDFSSNDDINGKQAIVVDYVNGVVHKFQCFGSDFFISNDFYGK